MTVMPPEKRSVGLFEKVIVGFARASVYVGLFIAIAGLFLVGFIADGGDSVLPFLISKGPRWWAVLIIVWLVASLALARGILREDGHLLADSRREDAP